jgi:hypothetical protein
VERRNDRYIRLVARLPIRDRTKVQLGALSAVIVHVAGFMAILAFNLRLEPVITGVLFLALPVVAYAFIAHPFGFWRDFEPPTIRLCVLLTIAYWFIYLPAFYYLTIFRFFL